MQDRSLANQLHRLERQLNALVILLGVLVTLAGFTVMSSGVDDVPFLLFILLPGVFVVLLCTYLIAAIVTPGRPQPEPGAATTDAEGE